MIAMSFDTQIRYAGGVTIFDLNGRLTSGLAGDSLRDKLFDAFEHGHRLLLLNCEGLTYVDSGGLGELVSAYAAMVRRGGALKLLRPSKRLAELLQLTRLDALFEIEDDEAAALAGFRAPDKVHTQRKLADYLSPDN
ncbi:Anti-sigma factor antagonist [Candidatus Sulfopaludibacter sp. SbA4]|nr:Anti-sigma factor antagonist [Candidatus Sulfopaludibacter sp. SbA4]